MKNDSILIFISEIKYSGAAKIALWLANRFLADGKQVTFVTYHDSPYSNKLNDGVEYICLNCEESNRFTRGLKVVKKLHKILKKQRPGVAISFLPTESLFMLLAAIGTKVPVVVAERSDPYLEKSRVASVGRYCFRFAKGAVFQTHGAMNFFPEKVQKRGTVIPNPAFAADVDPVAYTQRKNMISHVARLDIRQKRQDVLLRAFAIVADRYPDVTLEIYGDGSSEDQLKALAQDLNMGERVVFKGREEHVAEKIRWSKMFVLSSDFEGIPNAIIEALSVGLPVVSTDCSPGGARELIDDGVNGFIVPRNDHEALADKIAALLTDESQAAAMADKAPEIVDKLSENYIYSLWENYCSQIGD